MAWLHLPIIDGGAPDGKFETLWLSAGKMLHAELSCGRLIVLHCRGGLGRTGTVAARLLMERGVMVEEAIRRVRAARLGAIETTEQEDYEPRRDCRRLQPLRGWSHGYEEEDIEQIFT